MAGSLAHLGKSCYVVSLIVAGSGLGLVARASWAASACDPVLVRITAGEFAAAAAPNAKGQFLPAFDIQRCEVTQGQYDQCVRAHVCHVARRYTDKQGALLPAIGVSWFDATRYCEWRGMRLPTAAEWERAAGGLERRRYPWGDAYDCRKGNFGNFLGDGPCAATNPGKVVAVGSYPAGASSDGVLDMAGNVWEWIGAAGPQGRARRGAAVAPSASSNMSNPQRELRGSGCCSFFTLPETSFRYFLPASYLADDIGFRCARGTGVNLTTSADFGESSSFAAKY